MKLEVLTPDEMVFSGEVVSVQVPGSKGSFEVLNNHAPIVSSLDDGKMTIKTATETKVMTVHGGVIEVLKNKVVVLLERVTL